LRPSWSIAIVAAVAAVAVVGLPGIASARPTERVAASNAARGPVARFAALSGGAGISLAAANTGPSLRRAHYTEQEYSASGTATSYRSAGPLPQDGRYALTPRSQADYATRIVVRRPSDPSRFSGTVVVEWLNVSGGLDAAPEYTYVANELVRRGDAWVGVSAQRIGIDGGTVAVSTPVSAAAGAGKGIRTLDPARYGSLHHPGDAYSYDIYTQVARALRKPGAGGVLGRLHPRRLLAVGESQSAITLTTYVDGVQPLTHEFDGFLIHSRSGAAAPLGEPDAGIDIASSIGGAPTKIRTDNPTPTLMVETETDVLGVLGYYAARQPDSPRLRTWEMAGTAHADRFQVGSVGAQLGCPQAINQGQQTFVLRTALHDLDAWTSRGTTPPKAPRFEISTSTGKPTYVLDAAENVKGGIRTPAVDAPVSMLSGLPTPGASLICLLFGRTVPFTAAQVAHRYPSRAAYVNDYRHATDAAIRAGFVLPADRAELLRDASTGAVKP
jgi:hypothetical protein